MFLTEGQTAKLDQVVKTKNAHLFDGVEMLTLSLVLGLLLLVAIPAQALWRTLGDRPKRARIVRYRATIIEAVALMAFLAVVASIEGISAADLGLDFPQTTGALVGLGIAVVLVGGMITATFLAKPKQSGTDIVEAEELMPQTGQEAALFILLAFVIGFAWEVLYRGFLLWWLTPLTGIVGAVLVAGVAYGLAHGWESHRSGIASIISALLFCTGYALTGSLWWLIIIHTALPLVGMVAMRKAQTASSD